MQLQVNGDSLEFDGRTISDLLARLEIHGRRLAVEVNRDIIPKSEHADFALSDGDIVEIVHAIGGG
ncbi:thiamine biosynthesis protein ThiS [Isoalcanivorax pacificus W11-5]|uniref:Thiamine biosynthesis protein ThiS n=1 Tax=Isoalcanivorax pacificus W11-5 TaxID=391936 RepID=A0A0B4XJG8_9GAMM|nr:sulfur carrier protein ThiS [Isoalcanivorax pacificus]AJD46562.1 thiamine biosynthesis protein ThiS [Isoalcanivorax pacificus W11-5]